MHVIHDDMHLSFKFQNKLAPREEMGTVSESGVSNGRGRS